jgi:hypothetical protein
MIQVPLASADVIFPTSASLGVIILCFIATILIETPILLLFVMKKVKNSLQVICATSIIVNTASFPLVTSIINLAVYGSPGSLVNKLLIIISAEAIAIILEGVLIKILPRLLFKKELSLKRSFGASLAMNFFSLSIGALVTLHYV